MTKVLTMPLQTQFLRHPDAWWFIAEKKSQWLLAETEPLTLPAKDFHRWGLSGGCFIFYSGERERDREREGERERDKERERGWRCSLFTENLLTRGPFLIPQAGPCCCSAHCWGLKVDTRTPDGWGKSHPGFIEVKLLHILSVLTCWSGIFILHHP